MNVAWVVCVCVCVGGLMTPMVNAQSEAKCDLTMMRERKSYDWVGGDVDSTGTTFYVTPTGEGACTDGDPCSLEIALSLAKNGDVLDLSGSFGPDTYGAGYTIAADVQLTSSDSTAQFLLSPSTTAPSFIFNINNANPFFNNIRFAGTEPSLSPTDVSFVVLNSSSDVSFLKCTFENVVMGGEGAVRFVSVGSMGVDVGVSVVDCEVRENEGVSFLYVGGGSGVSMKRLEVQIEASGFTMNNNGPKSFLTPLIHFDTATASSDTLTLVLTTSTFLSNNVTILSGALPHTPAQNTTVELSVLTFYNNSFSIPTKFEAPYYFVDVNGAEDVWVDQIEVQSNYLNGIADSDTDPTLFAFIRICFERAPITSYTALITESTFQNNTELTPFVVACSKTYDANVLIQNNTFEYNNASLSAGFTVTSASTESEVVVEDCAFIQNSVADSSLLSEWSLQGDIILCTGKAILNITGPLTAFDDNAKSLRVLSGTCKKDCSGLPSDLALIVCGQVGVTVATFVMSGMVVAVVISLVIYHVIYITYLLPIKQREEEEYFALNNLN